MPPRGKRFSIYDAMEDAGYFAVNPANRESRDTEGQPLYKGPVEFPKMLYHPLGEEIITVPATAENTPFGPRMLGEQRELISKIVNDEREETTLLAEGWHPHPAGAITAYNERAKIEGLPLKAVPAISSEGRERDLRHQIDALNAELERTKKLVPQGDVEAPVTGVGQDASPIPPVVSKSKSQTLKDAGLV